jgi:hypothetical protein
MTIQTTSSQPLQLWTRRPDGVTVAAAYHYLIAVLFLCGTLIMTIPTFILGVVALAEEPDAILGAAATGLIAVVLMILCLIYLAAGYGLWKLRLWGRTTALALALVGLLAFPIGTIAGAILLWYLLRPEVAEHFR